MDNHKSHAASGALKSSVLDRALAGLSEARIDLTNARKPSDLSCDPHVNPLPEGRSAAPQTWSEAGLSKEGAPAPGEGELNVHGAIYETTSSLLRNLHSGETTARKQPSKAVTAFLRTQEDNLLELRAALVTAVSGIVRESRIDGNGCGGSADKVDAGKGACDRDVALSLVSEGTNALLEIDQALARITAGTYGIYEMTGRRIPRSRLEAIPFARFTVECQSQLEKEKKLFNRARSFESPFSVSEEPEDDD